MGISTRLGLRLMAAVLSAALVACSTSASMASASADRTAVPAPTGRVVNVGWGISVKLAAGWSVKHVYPPASANADATGGVRGPVGVFVRSSPSATMYVYGGGIGITESAPRLLGTDFHSWSGGLFQQVHASAVDAFKVGPTRAFDRAAGLDFTASASGVGSVKGQALEFVGTTTTAGASVFAYGPTADYTAAVSDQVEAMTDYLVIHATGSDESLVQVGRDVSVRLQPGWAALPVRPASGQVPPYVELYRYHPNTLLDVYANGPDNRMTASQFLSYDFPLWYGLHSETPSLAVKATGEISKLSAGPGSAFNTGAAMTFAGTATADTTVANFVRNQQKTAAPVPVTGAAFGLVDTQTALAAAAYAITARGSYSGPVRDQVDKIVASVMSPDGS